jgi:hypothetical protein
MEIYSPINTRVIDQELDLRALLNSLSGKSFAISPPIEVENSFMMGLANDDLNEVICSFRGRYAPVYEQRQRYTYICTFVETAYKLVL